MPELQLAQGALPTRMESAARPVEGEVQGVAPLGCAVRPGSSLAGLAGLI
jgi:hypothetical protein